MQIYSDSKVLELVEAYMHSSEHPDLVQYRMQTYSRDFKNKEAFLWSIKQLARLGAFHEKRVLDVGCGFGWQAFTMSLLGNEVTGIDILPSMIDGMTECVKAQKQAGVNFSVNPLCGDICNSGLPPKSFDGIYSMEAIEHVHDIPKMLDECMRLLKPRGTLLLVNDQNCLHKKGMEDTRAMWKKRESSWEWARQLEEWRPIEHKGAKPFAVMREEIVRVANPTLEDAAVGTIVQNSAGLLKPEIETLAKQYVVGITFRNVPEFDRCRNPVTGEFAERLFDPFALADLARAAGFKTTVRHFFRRFPLNLLNGTQFMPLKRQLFDLRSPFVIMGIKP